MLERINKPYFAPFYIFIKYGYELTDAELLTKLGLETYFLIDEQERQNRIIGKRYLFLTEVNNWTHLLDDWFYALWHNKQIRSRLLKLSNDFEIFTFRIPDVDDSYEFTY